MSPVNTIGVLALQGAFIEHINVLRTLGAETVELRSKTDLECDFDGIILPGGESTVMGKLLRELDMFSQIKVRIQNGLCVLGTCAGLLLLAETITNDTPHFATMSISAVRNAYGRQLGSFSTTAEFDTLGEIPMTFIRAPFISEVYGDAVAMAQVDGKIVAARQGNQLVTAFHPELSGSGVVHKYFLDMIETGKRTDR